MTLALSNSTPEATTPIPIPVIDYEGSGYRADFWQGQGRDYEDATERLALTRLLPPQGGRIAEVGAGFGRLADLYLGYDQVVLFDYSRTLLADAVAQRGGDPRFVFVAGNLYELPLATGVLDTLVMVRVMHHLAHVQGALGQLQRTLHRESVAVLEYANKRNLKAILRWVARRQSWSPFDREPLEFVALNFDFHPAWMDDQFAAAGLHKQTQLAVSHFRLGAIKSRVDAQALARWDGRLFAPAGRFPVSPSVFVRVTSQSGPVTQQAPVGAEASNSVAGLFRCVACAHEPLIQHAETEVGCPVCHARYHRHNQIWDFKAAE
ncbi:MAG: class I SAM-dependent methyltransferase [Caldilineaceae bacterium]|nr:class I SAM-dependent methyltransferase [Caldilineaceae bacterium]MBP8108570.1 class I SAM-dependent methyltransferase [Caldilineaceae bacterium]MBP8124402.1 class I SAM-dependent methyltransferase [Caldilineaceae bacterium]MBP9071308.1 class I SAM-dependent methyltransferase [Caldilineaceae bacterium]